MKRYFVAAALCVASPALAQPATAPDFVKAAGAGDLYERQSSQLVLQSTKNAKVREFATMMVKDHTNSTQMVAKAATQAGLKPKPPALMPEQAQMIAQLRGATGEARDKIYVTQQKAAHQKALALHQGYASKGDKAPLKAAAGKIAPVVEHHIMMLQGM